MNDTPTLPFPIIGDLTPLQCRLYNGKYIFTYALRYGDPVLEVAVMKLANVSDSPLCVSYVKRPRAQVPLWSYTDESTRFQKYRGRPWQHVVELCCLAGELPVLAIFEWDSEVGFGNLSYIVTIEEVVTAEDRLTVSDSVRLKRLIGRSTERQVCYSDQEHLALKDLEANERALSIQARPTVTVTVPDGREFSGIPATVDEWPLLPRGTPVVLVSAYDEGSNTVTGTALAVLRVQPTISGARAYNFIALTPLAPAAPSTELPTSAAGVKQAPTGYEVRFCDGTIVHPRGFANTDDLRTARKRGEFTQEGYAVIFDDGVPIVYLVTTAKVEVVSEKKYTLHPYL